MSDAGLVAAAEVGRLRAETEQLRAEAERLRANRDQLVAENARLRDAARQITELLAEYQK